MSLPVKLVEDLMPIILDSTVWTSTELFVLSLVSPVWLLPVRRRLYKHPTITSENQCRYLVRTLQSVEMLQNFVRGLNLWLEDFSMISVRGLAAIRFTLNLDGLESFSFLSPSANFLMQKIKRHKPVRRIFILPLIDPLNMLDSSGTRSLVEWYPRLPERFISLKTLAISGATLHVTPSHKPPHKFQLSDLIISRCVIIHGSLPQLLHPTSWSHLRNLFFATAFDDRVGPERYGLATILFYCRYTLQCFHLECQITRAFSDLILFKPLLQDAIEGQEPLVSLRELHLVDLVSRRDWKTTLKKIGRRCPNLEVLRITGRHWPSFELGEETSQVDIAEARRVLPQLTLLEGSTKILRYNEEYPESLLAGAATQNGLLEQPFSFPCGDGNACDEKWYHDIAGDRN